MIRLAPFVLALVLFAVGWVRGPLSSGTMVGGAEKRVVAIHEAALGRPAFHDPLPWTPAPERISRDLLPGETWRVLTVDQMRAMNRAGFPDGAYWWAARTAFCEGGFDPTARNGVHLGTAQVNPEFHGAVPPDLPGQLRQMAAIYEKHGEQPWDARAGCREWSAG